MAHMDRNDRTDTCDQLLHVHWYDDPDGQLAHCDPSFPPRTGSWQTGHHAQTMEQEGLISRTSQKLGGIGRQRGATWQKVLGIRRRQGVIRDGHGDRCTQAWVRLWAWHMPYRELAAYEGKMKLVKGQSRRSGEHVQLACSA